MKKKSFVVSLTMAVGLSTAALASGVVSQLVTYSAVSEHPIVSQPEQSVDLSDLSDMGIGAFVEANLNNASGIRTADQFGSIVNCSSNAAYANVCAYVTFMGENPFSTEQITIINRILDKGTTIQSLMQVYDFWLSTDEPFSIIEEICAMEDNYFSEFWYENAFNKITDGKHGVLSGEDIAAYREKGISYEEILAANTMSRKGVYTINQILDSVVNGANAEDIACEIYNVNALPEGENVLEKVNLTIESKKYKLSTARISDSESISTAISTAKTAYSDAIAPKAEAEIQRLGIDKPSGDSAEQYDAMQNTGLPIGTVRALMNKGYTPAEIAKIPDMDTDDIFTAAKMAREVMKNE